MSQRSQTLRALVTERLTAAAEEIFTLVERTILEYEEELCRSKEENQRKQQLLEEALRLRGVHATGETVPGLKQEQLDGPHIHEAPRVKVKEENPDEVPIALPREEPGETSEPQWELQTSEPQWELQTSEPQWELHMDQHMNVNEYFSDNNDMEEDVQDWTVPLNEEEEEDNDDGAAPETQTQAKTLVCSFCHMTFARLCQLKRHMTVHGCSFCNKICSNEEKLRDHMMLHTGERTLQGNAVENPDTQTPKKSKKQKKKSEERPFNCYVCKMAFKSSYNLRKHMYQHTGKRVYACSVCDDSFKRKWELDWHMSNHTGIPYKPKVQITKKRYKWH
uniref:C2H2-type domain-containing protein n=1 Tax=Neogobius melanostomus TaxID=47308 RepID=A0A8C6SGT2_9GOBI